MLFSKAAGREGLGGGEARVFGMSSGTNDEDSLQ
jgi:hypothetical protein